MKGQLKERSEAQSKLEHVIADLRGKLSLAEMDTREWKSEAEKARKEIDKADKAVKSAELQLEKALKDHTATQTALIQVQRPSRVPFSVPFQWCIMPNFSQRAYLLICRPFLQFENLNIGCIPSLGLSCDLKYRAKNPGIVSHIMTMPHAEIFMAALPFS